MALSAPTVGTAELPRRTAEPPPSPSNQRDLESTGAATWRAGHFAIRPLCQVGENSHHPPASKPSYDLHQQSIPPFHHRVHWRWRLSACYTAPIPPAHTAARLRLPSDDVLISC